MWFRNKYSNEEIIDGIISRDPKIIKFIYQHYYPMIENIIINNYYVSKDDVKDVFQEAILVIFRKVSLSNTFKIQFSFFTYLTTICKRMMINELRKKAKIVQIENEEQLPPDSEQEIIDLINKAYRFKLYQKHFKEIGKKCQELLQLFLEGYSVTEITNMLKMSSENFTKKRRSVCKDSLFIKIYYDPLLKELINGKPWTIREIPRW